MRVRIARDELRRLRELTQAINALEAEIAELIGHVARQLLTEPGGPLTAAKLVGEIAGADRFATDAKLARSARACADSGQFRSDRSAPSRSRRQPPDQRGDPPRRCHPRPLPSRDIEFVARKKGRRQDPPRSDPVPQAHLARRIWQLLRAPHPLLEIPPSRSIS
jgi:hypothetical protein